MSGKLDLLYTRMQDAIIGGDTIPRDFIGPPADTVAKRLAIYSQGYRIRLVKAVTDDYPALKYAMGDDPFTAMVECYIAETPSKNYNLERYSLGLPDYIRYRSENHFIHQLSMLEAAVRDVHMMPGSEPMAPGALTPETMGQAVLLPRTASIQLTFDYPVNRYLTDFREGERPERPDEEAASFTLVYRHDYSVKRYDFGLEEFLLFERLARGVPVAAALEECVRLGDMTEEFLQSHLQDWFTRWLSGGMIRA